MKIWILDPETLNLEASIAVGQHPAFVRVRRRRSASLCFQLGQPQREHHRHGNRPAGPRPGRRHPAQRHGPGARRPALRGLFGRQHGPRDSDADAWRKSRTGGQPQAAARRKARGKSWPLRSIPSSPEGSTPDAVAVAPDGKTLYVANADNNDVMVVDISATGRVADRRLHSRGLVSDGAGRLARQPHVAGGQRQGAPLAAELSAAGAAQGRAWRGLRSSGQAPGGLDRRDPAARRRRPGALHAAGQEELALHAADASTARRPRATAAFPTRPAASARSNTCSTSSRRTAPTTRCSATSKTPRAARRATAIRRW